MTTDERNPNYQFPTENVDIAYILDIAEQSEQDISSDDAAEILEQVKDYLTISDNDIVAMIDDHIDFNN